MIPTPALVVDLDVLERNIDAMAARVSGLGASLRPHVKTHKCLEIARLQLEAGAQGITVATVSEAEIFVEAGYDDVFIAYPLWLDEARAARLSRLTGAARIRIGVDSRESARQAAQGLRGAPVEAMVEVDSGHGRSGVRPEAAGELAAGIALPVAGAFTFPGHSYAVAARREAADQEREALATAVPALAAVGAGTLTSGGSSPSMAFNSDGLDELRPGAYVFNDAQQWELGACDREDVALTAHATVVSHAGGRLVLDSGSKVLGADRPTWASGAGRLLDHPEARIVQLSEHHAVAELEGRLPQLGAVVRVVPNHCCNAVNLADELVVVRGGRQAARWRVAARNANT